MRYGSVCSGIESASVAWEPLGMTAAWFSEIEPFPCRVLAHHWPHVTNLGDMTKLPAMVRAGAIESPDILVGGTPCQAFSVAGKRGSLDDARGQLTLTYVDLLNAIDEQRVGSECVAVWENVPGVLNTKDNAFGCFLGALSGSGCELIPSGKKWGNAGCVFGPQRAVAWRVIDAQYFGVAQRRRRVFVVASARKGFDPTKVLFEREGVRRDSAPSRETGQEVTSNAGNGITYSTMSDPVQTLCARDYKGVGNQFFNEGKVIAEIVGALDTECGYQSQAFQSVMSGHIVHGYRMTAFGEYADDDTASTMKARDYKDATDLAVTFGIPGDWIGRKPENGGNATEPMHNIAPCQTVTDRHTVATTSAVRRLTPTECERLQGFPDGHTNIPGAVDGHRYKALGNSKAVPCIRWIGERIRDQLEPWHDVRKLLVNSYGRFL